MYTQKQAYPHGMDSNVESRTLGFLFTSGVLHAALFAMVLFLSVEVPVLRNRAIVEISFTGAPEQAQKSNPASRLAAPVKKSDVSESPEMKAEPEVKVVKVKVQPTQAVVIPNPVPKKVQTKRPVPVELPKKAMAKTAGVSTKNNVAVPMQESAQDLADSLDREMDAIDQENAAKLQAAKERMQKETRMALAEQERLHDEMLREQRESEKALAAAAAAAAERRAKELAALKTGSGGAGHGIPEGAEIRSLAELSQASGNVKPQYDAEDRLARRQGEVVFVAYVQKDGSLGNFQMTKTSGHRTLDAKTLKALRTWKFMPGQQGWVELPFRWDLVGGAQAVKGNLRTSM